MFQYDVSVERRGEQKRHLSDGAAAAPAGRQRPGVPQPGARPRARRAPRQRPLRRYVRAPCPCPQGAAHPQVSESKELGRSLVPLQRLIVFVDGGRSELLPGQCNISFPWLSTDAVGKSGMKEDWFCRCSLCDTKCLSAFTRGKVDMYFKNYLYTNKALILTICFRRWEICLVVLSKTYKET